MPRNIPIRHHYIPRFILRNFADNKGYLQYYDCAGAKVSRKRPEDIFVVSNLYTDTINNADDPTKIETDLAKYENEIAPIIRKFLNDGETILTLEEDEKLKLFLAIMAFRAERIKEFFGDNASEENKIFYGYFQKDGNLTDFWLRNLGEIVKCRSLKEVLDNPRVDDPMKGFMMRDTYGLYGMYFMLLERRGSEDFVISDCYPSVVEGIMDSGLKLQMYMIYPISPKKAILFVSNGVEAAPSSVSGFDTRFYKRPKVSRDRRTIKIAEKKIYESDVKRFNKIAIDNAEEGIVIQGIRIIEKSKKK